jgi:AraC-like DNA-binding protein
MRRSGSVIGANEDEVKHQPLTIYYARRCFLLLGKSFVLDRHYAPYRRLAATLLLTRQQPFDLETDAGSMTGIEAALIAPKVLRKRIVAVDSDIAILDIPMDSPAYRRIAGQLRQQSQISYSRGHFLALFPLLLKADEGTLDADDFYFLHTSASQIIAEGIDPPDTTDTRVTQAMRMIDELPLDSVKLDLLAQQLDLSKSRLSHLFIAETGSTVSHYARWVAVWRAVNQWQQGCTWTRIAQDSGFYDLAHFDHAFTEVFGLKPSAVFDPVRVRLHRLCDPNVV